MKLTDVIRRPLITEKTSILREDGRTIVFQVAKAANKVEIKRAIETLLGAKVDSIRTCMAHGKIKRQGRFAGRRPDWKKAYVKLREGVTATKADVLKFLEPKLSKIEMPAEIEFRAELPKTMIGKLSKKELRAELKANDNKT